MSGSLERHRKSGVTNDHGAGRYMLQDDSATPRYVGPPKRGRARCSRGRTACPRPLRTQSRGSGLLDRDHPVVADLLYRVSDEPADLRITIRQLPKQTATSVPDAVDGSSTGTRVPKMWVLFKAPTIRRSYLCKRFRQLVSTSPSRFFRCTAWMLPV
jgi:hypothetical protein